jgi:N-formylglutamate amidohydrolase
MSEICNLERADGPLLVTVPHAGTLLPQTIASRMTAAGRALVDTDWDVDRLYAFAGELGATVLAARYSRYVIDCNRDPHGIPLIPGVRSSALCPTETFEGEPLYLRGADPTEREIAQRRATYWDPFHDALQDELQRIRSLHGYALILDAHSVWGHLPLVFEGQLPDVNLGTYAGRACDPALTEAVVRVVTNAGYSHRVDGRFQGSYITRRYGSPAHEVHALQVELNQRTYLAAGSRRSVDETKASALRSTLRDVCRAMLGWGTRTERTRPSVLE